MPLAEDGGAIARVGEKGRERVLPRRKPLRQGGREPALATRPHRQATGQQRRAAGRAFGLDVEVREARTFGCEAVEYGGGRSANRAAPVAAEVAEADVIEKKQDDIGAAVGRHALTKP